MYRVPTQNNFNALPGVGTAYMLPGISKLLEGILEGDQAAGNPPDSIIEDIHF